ncbi:GIY-YIG nuclease family protein [Paenibacillus aurantius]|uniref:GIY-YIG nuclease family protein n=1 Tax=Paenibacillus aurantius TaxID=2918900 RepID=A0AA96L8J1_9BACL|nr:GIY-YIG nuclease family protein [Paenibacillus aurantius]WNQ09006.1 GIY-YIG nuclease family protein [Paenibacillus aurantius]
MDKAKRKELIEEFKQIKTYMGVIQITNRTNGKRYLAAFPNLKNKWETIRAQLDMGRHMNSGLQRDWKEFGPEAFHYEILERKEAEEITDIKWEMKQILKPWMAKLQPYGERGYHKEPEDEAK